MTAKISEARMMPSLSVVHTDPSRRRNDAPVDSSPPKPIMPPSKLSTNHLNPNNTSTISRPRPDDHPVDDPGTDRGLTDRYTCWRYTCW